MVGLESKETDITRISDSDTSAGDESVTSFSSCFDFVASDVQHSTTAGSSGGFNYPDGNKGNRTILVTGGAGFIGSHTVDALLDNGDTIVIVDELNDYYDVKKKQANLKELFQHAHQFDDDRLFFYQTDICNVVEMTEIFNHHSFTHIIHLAARAGVRDSFLHPLLYIHSNIEGTTVLLELAVQFAVNHFIFASSSSVYGNQSTETGFQEDTSDSNHPVSPYAISKKSCEMLCQSFANVNPNLTIICYRFFSVYGPRGRPDMAPFRFISACLSHQPICINGDGSIKRDFTFVSDVVRGIVSGLGLKKDGCMVVINLGNNRPVSIQSLAEMTLTLLLHDKEDHQDKDNDQQHQQQVHIKYGPSQAGDVALTCANVSRAEELLGWRPVVDFMDGMRLTWEAMKTDFMT